MFVGLRSRLCVGIILNVIKRYFFYTGMGAFPEVGGGKGGRYSGSGALLCIQAYIMHMLE